MEEGSISSISEFKILDCKDKKKVLIYKAYDIVYDLVF
jgi:sRNA-binding regulator protein Hfq